MDVSGKRLQFNGVLSFGSMRHYVQSVSVKNYSIEGYGDDHDPNAIIYVVSPNASQDKRYDIWYKLGAPSRHYQDFQDAFQWVATLGKHVMDFMEEHDNIGLIHFRQEFKIWLESRFSNNADLSKWCQVHGSPDYRKSVHAHVGYLWSEASCLANDSYVNKNILDYPFWDECARNDASMIEPLCDKTVATPHVYKCFKNRYFAGQLMEVQPSDTVRQLREQRTRVLGLPSEMPSTLSSTRLLGSQQRQGAGARFKVGDVVSISPNERENEMWRKTAKDKAVIREWFGYVQRVESTRQDRQRLYVIWLYRPEDTTISTTDYPVVNELFMSDNCNCQDPVLLSTDIIGQYTVRWFSQSFDTDKDFLVRQKWVTETSSFITMKPADFSCDCHESSPGVSKMDTCRRGDTVYLGEKNVLEPVVVEDIDTIERKLTVRRLQRLNKLTDTVCNLPQRLVAANEIAWTDELMAVPYERIQGNCFVRFFTHQDVAASRIPFPYNRGGAGDYWVLSTRMLNLNGQCQLQGLTFLPRFFHEGPDYASSSSPKLPGLSLFSGLGNLDKGLEAGGAVKFHTFIDMNGRAIQTLRANAENPEELKLWHGSVDDYLHALLSGDSPSPENMRLIAKIGDVGTIAAGSPCPGFSKLQQDWLSEKSLRNASHVTTFASFVDVYRPEYAFLENVVNMGCARTGFEEELVLSQLVGCLVAMGYQTQQFIMSSWNYGSSQHRSRLILAIAAPTRVPIVPPRLTHSDLEGFKNKSVGKLLNGHKYGARNEQLTPFKHVRPEQTLGHLPNIGCGVRHPCIRYPDHRLRLRPNIKERRIMACVPTFPPGVGLQYAINHGTIPKYLYETKSEVGNKSYRRIDKDGLIGTIVTAPSPHDSRSGPFVHWEQNRCISLEEARIAQGIPEHEVLIGNINDQFTMAGNAVDRRLAEQLGLVLGRAVDQNQSKDIKISVKKNSVVEISFTAQEEVANLPATPVHTDIEEDKTMDSTIGINRTQPATGLRVAPSRPSIREKARGKMELLSRDCRKSPSSVSVGNEGGDEDDQGSVLRARKRHANIDSSNITQAFEARAQPQATIELGLQAEVIVDATGDYSMTDADACTAPLVAVGPNNFMRRFSKSVSAIPSLVPISVATEIKHSIPKPQVSSERKPLTVDTPRFLIQAKRSHEADNEDSGEQSYSRPKEGAHKRTKGAEESIQANRNPRAPNPTLSAYADADREGNATDQPFRMIRHSGMSVEHIPQARNKTGGKDNRSKAEALEHTRRRRYA
ncbi:hypothetical protein N0V90_002640 [Kalmusia sp. IMI 367209]|nr:hypothetical protein N0V90_002640 [Kalmusia sp. IMI 367209]